MNTLCKQNVSDESYEDKVEITTTIEIPLKSVVRNRTNSVEEYVKKITKEKEIYYRPRQHELQ